MVRQGRETLTREFDRLGIRYVPSKANFLLVETPIPAAEAYDRLLDEGIIVRPMAGFGLPDHIRVTVGTPEQNSRFLRAMARLAARR
jgi:histidinol-phosphate aminotransferase